MNGFLVHVLAPAGKHNLAALQDEIGGGEVTRIRNIAPQSRIAIVPRSARARITRSISLIIEGWMPSVGSSRISMRGRIM